MSNTDYKQGDTSHNMVKKILFMMNDSVSSSFRQINTAGSLQGGGDLTENRILSLVGDQDFPGPNRYYGTNASGSKGFYPFGSSLFEGSVNTAADLPVDIAAAPAGSLYIVLQDSGTWFVNRKPAGVYNRVGSAGTIDDWVRLGDFEDMMLDNHLVIRDDIDQSKTVQFQLSNLSAASNRTIEFQDRDGTLAYLDDLASLHDSLAAVAVSGHASDLAYDHTTSGLTATDVQAAIDELKVLLGTSGARWGLITGTLSDQPDLVAALSAKADSSALSAVATSGAYSDLIGTPSIPAAQVNSDWSASSGVTQILNKPALAPVATSGDYSDLTGLPVIPAAQVNSDWTASSGVSQILNKPALAAVATSGAYDDLSGLPALAAVALSGAYTDLAGRPTIPAAQVNSDWTASSGITEILNKPSLATVATSGAYADLSGRPSLVAIATSGQSSDVLYNHTTSGLTATNVQAAIDEIKTLIQAGTVTSVGVSVPSFLSVSGTPVTSNGTIAIALANAAANTVLAGPATGAATAPTIRALVAADIPDISTTYAKLASPALTGIPTAPTQTAGNNTTRIATTAFVTTAVKNNDVQYGYQTFTSSGTWTPPAGTLVAVFAYVIAGGGGGGGGRYANATSISNVTGGGGGSPGGRASGWLIPTSFAGGASVTVGAGGTAGNGVSGTTTSTNGANGGNGGASSFGGYINAVGGNGGPGGATGGGSATAAPPVSEAPISSGGAGAGSNVPGTPNNGYAGAGGGGGGQNNAKSGSDGLGGTGGANGFNSAGGAGTDSTDEAHGFGGGGGGGGSQNNSNGATSWNGGIGGTAGGGGGGGGGAWGNGIAAVSGNGGAGGRGSVTVHYWYQPS